MNFVSLQESEIVEVLWKQDVDLGYTLAPVKSSSPKESANVSGPSFNTEDNEKLKALQELKNEKVSFLCIKHKIYKTLQLSLEINGRNRLKKKIIIRH